MYASIVPNATFERNGYCVTSDIFPNQTTDTVFALTNALRLDSPQGVLKTIEGDAYPTLSPGKFKIKFDTVEHTGDYWITALGDPSAENDYLYPWSIVSSSFRTSLFILARNVTQFRSQYQNEVLKIAKKQGFNKSYNSPLPTYQEPDCQYAPQSNTRRALGISTYHDMIRITENSADSKPRNLRKSKFHK
jgi:lipocalin